MTHHLPSCAPLHLAPSALATLASSLLLQHPRQSSESGPLQWLLPLPRMLFVQVLAGSHPRLYLQMTLAQGTSLTPQQSSPWPSLPSPAAVPSTIFEYVCGQGFTHPIGCFNAVANLKGREGLRLAGHIPIDPAGPVGQPWIFPTTHLGPPTQHYLVSMVAISNGRGPLPTSPAQPRVSFWRGPDRRLPMGRYRAGMESSFWCWWLGARHLVRGC